MKFTHADFTSAITGSNLRSKSQLRINISRSNLRLPVAPPSPLFDGINEDIDTTRFPAFQDPPNIHQSVPAPHCTLHCGHQVCMHVSRKGIDSPACQCESEEREHEEEEETVTSWYRPEMDLDYLVMSSIEDSIANADPLHEINVHYTEVLKILAHLRGCAMSLVSHNEHLVYAMRCDYPGHEEEVARAAVDHIFRIMRLYFHRTLCFRYRRSISIQQLQRELNVYLWTLFVEWVEAYCDDATRDCVLEHRGPLCVTKVHSGSSAVVLEFWRESIEDVLGLLVWRDEEVRLCKIESGVVFCVLTILLLCVLVPILWGNVGSHG